MVVVVTVAVSVAVVVGVVVGVEDGVHAIPHMTLHSFLAKSPASPSTAQSPWCTRWPHAVDSRTPLQSCRSYTGLVVVVVLPDVVDAVPVCVEFPLFRSSWAAHSSGGVVSSVPSVQSPSFERERERIGWMIGWWTE